MENLELVFVTPELRRLAYQNISMQCKSYANAYWLGTRENVKQYLLSGVGRSFCNILGVDNEALLRTLEKRFGEDE